MRRRRMVWRRLDAAVAAQEGWAATAPRERGEILRRAFELMTARAEELALLMTLEMGKPLAESRGEVTYAAEFFRWFSEEAVRIAGRWSTSPDGATRLMTMKQPVGPTLMITPWNFPLAMGTRKIGPAIAAGLHDGGQAGRADAVDDVGAGGHAGRGGAAGRGAECDHDLAHGAVMEPLIRGPAAAQADVHRVDRGRAGGWWSSRPSSCCGCRWSWAGTRRSWCSADADLDAAVDGAMLAKMRNIGEACTAANRFIVHESRGGRVRPPVRRADGRR